MLINFNMEKLNKLLHDFYSITGIAISVWNADFQQLSVQPQEMYAFCRIIKSTSKGKQACFLSDKKICSDCSKTGKPTTHTCHAGLIDVAFPIKYKDTVLGYIMFGQIAEKSEKEMQVTIARLAKTLGVDKEALTKGYKQLIKYDENVIEAAANILKLATRYLWLSEYIDIYDTTAASIDEYIQDHMHEDITVGLLCRVFTISKKRLYDIAYRNFGVPIWEYICTVRLNKAKHLLTSTDYPVKQIADMVGINDYNYFTKFFKARVGTSPLKYRKGFPFNIHK